MKSFLSLFILLCTPFTTYHAIAGETITYGYVNFPPFMYPADEFGQASGITKEILDLVAKDTNIKIEFTEFPVARFVHMIKTGKIDFFVVSDVFAKQANVEALNVCNEESVMTLQPTIFFPKSIQPSTDLSFLAGQDLLIPREAYVVFKSFLPKDIHLTPYENVEMMSKMLINNRTSYIIDYDMRTQHLLDKSNFSKQYQQLKLSQLKTFACMRQSLYDAQSKASKLQKAYVNVMYSDEGAAIFKKHNFTRPAAPKH